MVNENPIHVVVAQDEEEIVIISVYRPDLNKFEPDFRTRRETCVHIAVEKSLKKSELLFSLQFFS